MDFWRVSPWRRGSATRVYRSSRWVGGAQPEVERSPPAGCRWAGVKEGGRKNWRRDVCGVAAVHVRKRGKKKEQVKKRREHQAKGGERRRTKAYPRASARQMAHVANERLKLLLLLREVANTTANKGGVRHRRIPAVAQLSPKISQTHVVLPLQSFAVILQEEALHSNASRRLFCH